MRLSTVYSSMRKRAYVMSKLAGTPGAVPNILDFDDNTLNYSDGDRQMVDSDRQQIQGVSDWLANNPMPQLPQVGDAEGQKKYDEWMAQNESMMEKGRSAKNRLSTLRKQYQNMAANQAQQPSIPVEPQAAPAAHASVPPVAGAPAAQAYNPGFFESLANVGGQAVKGLASGAGNAVAATTGATQHVPGIQPLAQVATGAGNLVNNVAQAGGGLVLDAAKGIGRTADTLFTDPRNAGNVAWQSMKDTGNNLAQAGQKTWNGITDAGTAVGNAVGDAGKQAWNGITNAGSAVGNAVTDAGNAIGNGFKKLKFW